MAEKPFFFFSFYVVDSSL